MIKGIKQIFFVVSCCIFLSACQSKEKQSEKLYLQAEQLYQDGDLDGALIQYIEANEIFEKPEYLEKIQYIEDESEYNRAKDTIKEGNYEKAAEMLKEIPEFKDSNELLIDCYYQLGQKNIEEKNYTNAITLLEKAGDYQNSNELLSYVKALSEYESGDLKTAKTSFEALSGYADSDQYLKNIAAFESIQGEWRTSQYMRNGKSTKIRPKKNELPALIVIGREMSTISYNLEETQVNSVIQWVIDYVNEDGMIVVNNQHGQARYSLHINEDGELVESSDDYEPDNYTLYQRIGDATDVPVQLEKPAVGMTESEILNSKWGSPKKKNKTTTAYGTREQWVYERGYIYFENGIVTAIQE